MRAGDAIRPRRQGFTYVAMLIALAIFSVGLAAIGQSWSTASRREREEELIAIGSAYVRAIGAYYQRSPGAVKTYPQTLEELVGDRRFVDMVRHVRRVYRDPINRSEIWGLVTAPDGGIMGVYSLSDKATLRRQPLALPQAAPIAGARYSDWKFVYMERP